MVASHTRNPEHWNAGIVLDGCDVTKISTCIIPSCRNAKRKNQITSEENNTDDNGRH